MSTIPFSFEPTRIAGLDRLSQFAPRMGRDYSNLRNTDEGPGQRKNVSLLSPYLRFRMISEEEVLLTTLGRFSLTSAEKFIHEVFWRAYFKGHLETRPAIWHNYLRDVDNQQQLTSKAFYQRAVSGQTGIDCFDAWVEELITTGYLHNHARMWFASIWIFTLKLPWQLGADFMYRHLMDGDPASNTLSWRWVGGLHTKGKTYLARADNIEKYTNGRFSPQGLASFAVSLEEPLPPTVSALPAASSQWPTGRYGVLITGEDLMLDHGKPVSIAMALHPVAKPGGPEGGVSATYRQAALQDAASRVEQPHILPHLAPDDVLEWCKKADITTVAVACATVGPEAAALTTIEHHLAQQGVTLLRIRRRYDALTFPHASKGFFAMKEKIPAILEKLELRSAQGQLI
jgi:deoxyribodipyrimidine photo-lyase